MLLIAGGGFALAKAGSNTIIVCVNKHGGALYKGHCHKNDKKLSWEPGRPGG